MSVIAENYLIRLKPSIFLIKVSYTDIIIKISALNRFLRSDWTFHRLGFQESSLGLFDGSEHSEKCCPGLVFLARFMLKIIF